MPADQIEHGAGVWLSITELAKREGVGKSTISERVAKLAAEDLELTKPGRGKQKLVNLARFLAAVGKAGDVAKELAAADRGAAEPNDDDAAATPAYRDAQTRDRLLASELKRLQIQREQLELAERLKQVVSVADLAQTMQEAGEMMVRAVDRVPGMYGDDIAAAVGREGNVGARGRLKLAMRELRQTISDALSKAASQPIDLPPDETDMLTSLREAGYG
jgi:hypothetical protein